MFTKSVDESRDVDIDVSCENHKFLMRMSDAKFVIDLELEVLIEFLH